MRAEGKSRDSKIMWQIQILGGIKLHSLIYPKRYQIFI